MELWIGSINLGILYAFMAIGIFITSRIYNFADITVDGSFTSGAATAAVLIAAGVNPFLSLIAAFFVGFIAGAFTAFINTRLNIHSLLAGIIVMTGLYSINLHIMGKSNIPLLNAEVFNTVFEKFNPGLNPEVWLGICLIIIMSLFWLAISIFFKTDFGIRMRATGDNPIMSSAYSVNVDKLIIFGVAFSNGFVGISGGLVAQYQGFADIGMGIGTLVIGYASVIIGESILRGRSIYIQILSAIIGSVIFRLIIALALYAGMDPIDLKLLTAVFVLGTLIISKSISKKKKSKGIFSGFFDFVKKWKKIIFGVLILLFLVVSYFVYQYYFTDDTANSLNSGQKRLVIFYFNDNPLLEMAVKGVKDALDSSGILIQKNIKVDIKSASGEFALAQSIAQNIVETKYDYIITQSTPTLQLMANANKKIPHVFGAVTDPYRVGVAKTPEDHIPNVTGIATFQPLETTCKIMRQILPTGKKIGIVWNPSEANSSFCTMKARVEAKKNGFELLEVTVTNTNDVLDAVKSLIGKKIDAFLTSGDLTVMVQTKSVAILLRQSKIPYFTNTPADIDNGAFLTVGADYYEVGRQTARFAIKVINGGDPKDIPIQNYVPEQISVNLSLAEEFRIKVPQEIVNNAIKVVR